ncbi:MAG: DUF5671 domain-containing protein, partial [Chloroflexi bacterium]|nr:DUF5671 domain-containing protein [Chloroflexota bacterium]
MSTIRRLYAYLLAFAGLEMVSLAAANLAQVLIDVVLQAPPATSAQYVRDTVSLSGALALVGLPVWVLHWRWIQHMARADPHERASTLRRLYLYLVLGGAVLVMGIAVRGVLLTLFDVLAGVLRSGTTVDAIIRPLPFAAVGALVWLAHWRIAASDRDQVVETGSSATLRRWYLHLIAFVGLLILLNGARSLVAALWQAAARSGDPGGAQIALAAADTLVGLGIWMVHWVVLPVRLPETARRDDAVAVLRSVYLFLALAMGVVGALLGGSQLLYYAVARLL